MSEAPPPPHPPGDDAGKSKQPRHPLMAQMRDPAVSVSQTLDLAMAKIMQVEGLCLERLGGAPLEVQQVVIKITEAATWWAQIRDQVHTLLQNPGAGAGAGGIQVASEMPPENLLSGLRVEGSPTERRRR